MDQKPALLKIRSPRRRSALFRLLATTLLASFIPMILISIVHSYDRSQDMRYQSVRQANQVASSIASQFEVCVDDILKLNSNIALSSMLTDDTVLSSISRQRDLIRSLSVINSLLPYVAQYGFVLLDDTDQVFAPTGKYTLPIYLREVLNVDAEKMTVALDRLKTHAFMPLSGDAEGSLLLVPHYIYAKSEKTAVGLYKFDDASVSSFFKSFLPKGYMLSEITDGDGDYVYSARHPRLDAVAASASVVRDEAADANYIVGRAQSRKGFGCVVIVDEDVLLKNAAYYHEITRMYILLAIALCLLLIAILIVYNYLPIMRLVQQISGHRRVRIGQNEFQYISDTYAQHVDEKLSMQSELNQYRLSVYDNLYSRLLGGGRLTEAQRSMVFKGGAQVFVIAAPLSEIEDIDAILVKNSIEAPYYAVELYRDGALVFVCHSSADDRSSVVKQVAALIQGARMGVSAACDDINELHDCFAEAFEQVCAHRQTERDEERETADPTTTTLIGYVDAHYLDPDFCVAVAADFLGISEYSTGKLLRGVYGANFRHVINEKRVDYAKTLLLTTDDPINDIAKKTGFTSASYFIKVFRELENLTPAQYRQLSNEIQP